MDVFYQKNESCSFWTTNLSYPTKFTGIDWTGILSPVDQQFELNLFNYFFTMYIVSHTIDILTTQYWNVESQQSNFYKHHHQILTTQARTKFQQHQTAKFAISVIKELNNFNNKCQPPI